jgi:hypothetical protein
MAAPSIEDEIATLKAKFPEVAEKDLKKALHQAWKPVKHSRKEEKEAIAAKMKEVVGAFDKVTLAVLKRSLVTAWNEKYPDGVAKTKRAPSEWHTFMRENRDRVMAEHPSSTQHERIKILGVMYKAYKAAQEKPESVSAAATPPPVAPVKAGGKKKN